jgi:Transposase IS4
MPSNIRIGCRVSGAVGPLLDVDKGTITEDNSTKVARRRRQHFMGTVVGSAAEKRWTVYWDDIKKSSDHSFSLLKFVAKPTLEEADLKIYCTEIYYLGGQKELDQYFYNNKNTNNKNTSTNKNTTTTNNKTTTNDGTPAAPLNMPTAQPKEIQNPISNPTNQSATGTEEEPIENSETIEEEDDNDESNDRFDPQATIMDILQEERSGRMIERQQRYEKEKKELISNQIEVGPKKGPKLTWTVTNDIKKEDVPTSSEFNTIGIKNFDFRNSVVVCPDGKNKRINFLDLLIHLWPGDWLLQLQYMNKRIIDNNNEATTNKRGNRYQKICEISPQEFWKFIGIMLVARIEGRKGEVWDRTAPEGYGNIVNMGEVMTENRFKQLRIYFAYLFSDEKNKLNDPWWQIRKGINEYNNNRKKTILASATKVLDESMSAFRPQTTKNGNLPNLSHIERKPEDLGTELKVVACSKMGLCLYLEIQEGRDPMRVKEFTDEFKVTAACTLRLAKYTIRKQSEEDINENNNQTTSNTYTGDSWFGSVELCAQYVLKLGANFVGVIKNSHSFYPKQYLENTMREWGGGSHLVLQTKYKGVDLVAVGYKYNKKKVMCFVFNKGLGHTENGKPYEARWKDDNNNTRTREVPRPDVVAKYYEGCNIIDVHNQSRQYNLRLEKHWVTEDGFFRLMTTIVGICITDSWKGYQHHLHDNHRHKGMELLDFAKILAKDMIENKYTNTPTSQSAYSIMDVPPPPAAIVVVSDSSQTNNNYEWDAVTRVSTLSSISPIPLSIRTADDMACQHTLLVNNDFCSHIKTEGEERRVGKRRRRGKCIMCGRNTAFYCGQCPPLAKRLKAWCCNDAAGRSGERSCLREHQEEICEEIKTAGTDLP